MKRKLTIKEVAKAMEQSEQYVRIGLQTERLKFGTAVQKKQGGNWTYNISPHLFKEYVGEEIYNNYIETNV